MGSLIASPVPVSSSVYSNVPPSVYNIGAMGSMIKHVVNLSNIPDKLAPTMLLFHEGVLEKVVVPLHCNRMHMQPFDSGAAMYAVMVVQFVQTSWGLHSSCGWAYELTRIIESYQVTRETLMHVLKQAGYDIQDI